MAKIYGEADVDAELLRSKRVGVVGYGNQGHAHALNLRDSGIKVHVALHATSSSRAKALAEELIVESVEQCARWADVLVFCTPDVPMGTIYCENVVDHLRPGQTLLFAHGFSIVYGQIKPPPFVDVAMVSPKGPGVGLRASFVAGGGLPALVAVHQDPSGQALAVALSYAGAIGCARLGIIETTFREETETDLFGEQAVLCGGIPELIKAGFDTLVAAGYQPEVAYFECLHETKLIVDLIVAKGLAGMRKAISDTAEWGGFETGTALVTDNTREAMRETLSRIQNGDFARNWIAENSQGLPKLKRLREEEAALPVEEAGRRMRSMMEGV